MEIFLQGVGLGHRAAGFSTFRRMPPAACRFAFWKNAKNVQRAPNRSGFHAVGKYVRARPALNLDETASEHRAAGTECRRTICHFGSGSWHVPLFCAKGRAPETPRRAAPCASAHLVPQDEALVVRLSLSAGIGPVKRPSRLRVENQRGKSPLGSHIRIQLVIVRLLQTVFPFGVVHVYTAHDP